MTVETDATGAPAAVKYQMRRSNDNDGGQEEKTAVVETILESWRIDDEWWRQPIARRYFAVVLQGGMRVVLFEDLVTGQWSVQNP